MGGTVNFITRNGEEKCGYIIYTYRAFEGGIRHVIRVDGDRDYRCKEEHGVYKELVC